MRILHVAAATILLGFTAASTPAFASCGSANACNNNQITTNTSASEQHFGLYNTSRHNHAQHINNQATHSSFGPTAHHSAHTMTSTSMSTASTVSTTGHATNYIGTLNSYGSTTPFGSTHTLSNVEAASRYGSGSISKSFRDKKPTIIPFSTGNITSYRIPGMGANETLVPTQCPVSVYNPNGGKVLGCYAVAKPAPARAPLQTVVVRPIIYVRYPVPTPVYFPVYQQHPPIGYGHHHRTSDCGHSKQPHQQQGPKDRWIGRPSAYPMPAAPRLNRDVHGK